MKSCPLGAPLRVSHTGGHRLIILFAVEDGEALYKQQKKKKKKDQELTVAQIMNCLLKNSDLNSRQ